MAGAKDGSLPGMGRSCGLADADPNTDPDRSRQVAVFGRQNSYPGEGNVPWKGVHGRVNGSGWQVERSRCVHVVTREVGLL